MKTSQELVQDKGHHTECAETILDEAEKQERALSEQERLDVDEHLSKARTIQDDLQERQQSLETRTRAATALEALKTNPGASTKPGAIQHRVEHVPLHNKLVAFRDANDALESGHWLMARLFGSTKSERWCADHGISLRAQIEADNTLGGALVPQEMARSIIDLREQYGVFRRNVRIMPMGSDLQLVPRRTGGLTAYFVSEGTAATESTATFDNVQLAAKKLMAWARMSTEVAEDAIIDLADWLAQELAYAFAFTEDTIGFNGTGTAAQGGIIGLMTRIVDGNHAAGAVDTEGAAGTADVASGLVLGDFHKLMGALPEYAKPMAKWYCSGAFFEASMVRLAAAAGGNTFGTIAGGAERSFLGFPVEISQVLPTAATSVADGVAMCAFGELSKAAMMGERRGISVSTTDQRYWDTDQIGIKATQRMDIAVHDLGDGTTAGPIVAMVSKGP